VHGKLRARAVLVSLLMIGSALTAATVGAPAAVAASASGSACSGSGGSSGGGGASGQGYAIWAELNTHLDMCASGGNAAAGSGGGGGSGASAPVPCWWGPMYSPAQLFAEIVSLEQSSSDLTYAALQQEYDHNGYTTGGQPAPLTTGYQSTDGPQWESFNEAAAPTGTWWGMYFYTGDTQAQMTQCQTMWDSHYPEMYYWVPDGTQPNIPGGVVPMTPEDLAQYVYSVIDLPNADVTTNPAQGVSATVSLPTWMWAANDQNTEAVDNICAAATCVNFAAQAESFTITTEDGTASITDSGCVLQPNGDVGAAYSSGGAFSCGIDFGSPGSFGATVATTWQVKISWPGGTWSPATAPVIDTALPQPIAVQEVQAVNN
jgi:enoyl reductase